MESDHRQRVVCDEIRHFGSHGTGATSRVSRRDTSHSMNCVLGGGNPCNASPTGVAFPRATYEISRRCCRPSRVVRDATLHTGASRVTTLRATPRSGRFWRGHIRHCNTSKGAMCHGAFGCLPKMGHGGSLLFLFSCFKVGSASKSGDNKTFPSEAENAVSKTPGFFDGVGLSEMLYSGPEFRAGMYRCL